MKTIKLLWIKVFNRSLTMLLLLILSSSVFAFSIFTTLTQKIYLERLSLYLENSLNFSSVFWTLIAFYLVKCITGGFLTPFGHAKDLFFEYIITKNALLSQHKQSNKLCLLQLESPLMYNLIEKAKTAFTSGALKESINTIGAVLTLVISLTTMVTALFIINPVYAGLAIISVIPCFINQLVFAKKFSLLRKAIIENKRKKDQCITHIVGKEFMLETRISGAAKHFISKWEQFRYEIERKEMHLEKYKFLVDTVLNLIKSLAVATIILMTATDMAKGFISVGTFSAVVSILSILQSSTTYFISKISSVYSQYYELKEAVQYYTLDIENDAGLTVNTINDITMKNVSFKYPSRDNYTLNNITKTFCKGSNIAILGANGAGKTTLVKILLGLYKPTKGTVLYNNIDVNNLNKREFYKKTSAVFQYFNIYNFTIKENINFKSKYVEDRRTLEVLKLAGFNLIKYKNKENTLIGKEFNGIELSRGESQKIALARAYYNDKAEIIVIDEPTAALDPIAEEALYKKFIDIAKDKTAFIVSHRLGSVRIADRILVMDDGKIVEDGSHEQLLKLNGLYANMYKRQSDLYK